MTVKREVLTTPMRSFTADISRRSFGTLRLLLPPPPPSRDEKCQKEEEKRTNMEKAAREHVILGTAAKR